MHHVTIAFCLLQFFGALERKDIKGQCLLFEILTLSTPPLLPFFFFFFLFFSDAVVHKIYDPLPYPPFYVCFVFFSVLVLFLFRLLCLVLDTFMVGILKIIGRSGVLALSGIRLWPDYTYRARCHGIGKRRTERGNGDEAGVSRGVFLLVCGGAHWIGLGGGVVWLHRLRGLPTGV